LTTQKDFLFASQFWFLCFLGVFCFGLFWWVSFWFSRLTVHSGFVLVWFCEFLRSHRLVWACLDDVWAIAFGASDRCGAAGSTF
jgi:hypothetical protein